MKQCQIIQELEAGLLKSNIPDFRVGDTVSVHTRIIEGEKERLQVFTGTVIARKGSCLSETFSLYRVSYGSGMEKVFMVHSPRIAKIEVVKMGDVRRGKLYYLRGVSGKAAKVKELIGSNKRILAAREAKKAQ
ncbi:MAG: 50S ribosomal protein L19 [Chlamydiia bacterium]